MRKRRFPFPHKDESNFIAPNLLAEEEDLFGEIAL